MSAKRFQKKLIEFLITHNLYDRAVVLANRFAGKSGRKILYGFIMILIFAAGFIVYMKRSMRTAARVKLMVETVDNQITEADTDLSYFGKGVNIFFNMLNKSPEITEEPVAQNLEPQKISAYSNQSIKNKTIVPHRPDAELYCRYKTESGKIFFETNIPTKRRWILAVYIEHKASGFRESLGEMTQKKFSCDIPRKLIKITDKKEEYTIDGIDRAYVRYIDLNKIERIFELECVKQ